MPPMHANLGSMQEGITDRGIDFYVARAKGGFGLMGVGVIDAFFVDHAGSPHELFLDNDLHVQRYARSCRSCPPLARFPTRRSASAPVPREPPASRRPPTVRAWPRFRPSRSGR